MGTNSEFKMLIPKGYKHTHRICNTYCFSTATLVTRTRLHVMLYIHCFSHIFNVEFHD